ncbi:MAG: hypothetical protein J5601_03280, partial [Elusimicrobiaceae bacterium]|nr:hypothetical protein [Elusimicrobiaceae bacterium]
MKYWVYINDKVDGPYEGEKLATLPGFTPDTLICSETDAASGQQAWAKASEIFDFEPSVGAQISSSIGTDLLLQKLEAITVEMGQLQLKLDSMETNMQERINQALEEQRAQFVSAQNNAQQSPKEEPFKELPPMAEEHIGEEASSNTASSEEEELVIRSALDSLYNAKLIKENEVDEKENTFQDLLTPQQAKDLAAEAEKNAAQKDQSDQQDKDNLLNELASLPKEDVVDQIIKEKEADSKGVSAAEAAALGAVAGVGLASLAAATGSDTSSDNLQDLKGGSFQITPDKNDPSHVENVQPANKMPEDVNLTTREDTLIPGIQTSDLTPQQTQNSQGDDNEDTLQELVPGAKTENTEGALVTEKDLQEAFSEKIPNPGDDLVVPFSEAEFASQVETDHFATQVSALPNAQNSGELTEIELKEGATYLISDFVPPAQVSTEKNLETTQTKTEKVKDDDTEGIQDMLTAATEEEKNKAANMDIASTLQQTNTGKRGASFDIKTVPMVQEPNQSERLHVEGLEDDVNAQHDIKPADKSSAGLAKKVILALVALLLLLIAYVVLAFMHKIPSQFNILFKEKSTPVAAAQMEEILPEATTQENQNADPMVA